MVTSVQNGKVRDVKWMEGQQVVASLAVNGNVQIWNAHLDPITSVRSTTSHLHPSTQPLLSHPGPSNPARNPAFSEMDTKSGHWPDHACSIPKHPVFRRNPIPVPFLCAQMLSIMARFPCIAVDWLVRQPFEGKAGQETWFGIICFHPVTGI